MSARTVLLAGLLLPVAFAFGLGLGWAAGRSAATIRLPSRPPRTPIVERALTAWAEGDESALRSELSGLPLPVPGEADPDLDPEVLFLQAVASGDRVVMGWVASAYGDRPAGGRARWWILQGTAPGTTRDDMQHAFARAYPDAWVLDARVPGGGAAAARGR